MLRRLRTLVAGTDEVSWLQPLPRDPPVERRQMIVDLCRDRRVIHLGFTDERQMDAKVDTGRWLHASLAEVAGSLVGLDVDSAGVDWAVATGYEAYVVDVQDEAALAALRLAPADVVVAGEIIEHVESPGLFLRSVRPLLAESGRLVVTTPNAYRLPGFLALTLGEELIHPDHVGIHSVHTLRELGRRCGYRVERLGYYQNQAVLPRSGVGLAISGLRRLQSAALRRWPYWSDGVYAIYSRNLLDL